MMRKLALALLGVAILSLLLLVVGCSRKAAPSTYTVEKETDSIHTKIEYRDVPVLVPGEKVVVKEYIECDKATNQPKEKEIKAKSGKSFVDVSIKKDGSITATGGCDSLTVVIQAKDSIIAHYKTMSKSKTETKVVTEYINHWYDPYCRGFSLIVLLAITLYLVHAFLKFKNLI